MKRELTDFLLKDLQKKPVLLSGPRQCGKTYLSKSLNGNKDFDYLNFDIIKDRKRLFKMDWYRDRSLVIFDEIHKMKRWKAWLKGIFDSDEETQQFLVTGSAKIGVFKKVGDSLAGRYFSYRLYPIDLKELRFIISDPSARKELQIGGLSEKQIQKSLLERLLLVSGFPEPFLENDKSFYNKWQQVHLDVILKQDILETEKVHNIKQLETLAMMLTERVGSLLSYNSIREDLATDDKTVKRWVDLLENSYLVFRLYPYTHKSLTTGLKKSPKLYFYDYCRIEDEGARLENLVALSLLKEVHFRRDALGQVYDLQFLRDKQQKEIDFLILKNKKPHLMIEVKMTDTTPSESFSKFEKSFPDVKKIQLVQSLDREHLTSGRVLVAPVSSWLSKMDF